MADCWPCFKIDLSKLIYHDDHNASQEVQDCRDKVQGGADVYCQVQGQKHSDHWGDYQLETGAGSTPWLPQSCFLHPGEILEALGIEV